MLKARVTCGADCKATAVIADVDLFAFRPQREVCRIA